MKVEAEAKKEVNSKPKSEDQKIKPGKIKLMAENIDAQYMVHATSVDAPKNDNDNDDVRKNSVGVIRNAFEVLMMSKGDTPNKTPGKRRQHMKRKKFR